MNPQLETYLIAGFTVAHLGMVIVTLAHIICTIGLRPPGRGTYWFAFVLFSGFFGYVIYWTCRAQAERLMISYHNWCQKKFRRVP